jgi:hypothetical protein
MVVGRRDGVHGGRYDDGVFELNFFLTATAWRSEVDALSQQNLHSAEGDTFTKRYRDTKSTR